MVPPEGFEPAAHAGTPDHPAASPSFGGVATRRECVWSTAEEASQQMHYLGTAQ